MLNRRILRGKVFKTLYACRQSEQACLELSRAYIDEYFGPDLFSEIPEPKVQREKRRKAALQAFNQRVQTGIERPANLLDDETEKVLREAFLKLTNGIANDRRMYKTNLLTGLDKIYDSYLLFFVLFGELADLARRDYEERKLNSLVSVPDPDNYRLMDNKAIEVLRTAPALRTLINRKNLKIDVKSDFVMDLYRTVKKSETYIQHCQSGNRTFESDKAFLIEFFRLFVMKSEKTDEYFGELDLDWGENNSVVKSMCTVTLKSLSEDSDDVHPAPLSKDWDQDRLYAEKLLVDTLRNYSEYEAYYTGKLVNWENDRVALSDRIIVTMALSEMINFPGIPVKVSINEYLEIAKIYGTQYGRQFVNGILDNVSAELVEQKIIKKSGRGLIDN